MNVRNKRQDEWTDQQDEMLLSMVLPKRMVNAAGEAPRRKWPEGMWAEVARALGRSVNSSMRRFYLLESAVPAAMALGYGTKVDFSNHNIDSVLDDIDCLGTVGKPPPALERGEAMT